MDELSLKKEPFLEKEKTKAEKNKEKLENIDNAKKRFEILNDKEKNNLNVLYQYCTSYPSFVLKKGRCGKKSGLLCSFEEEIDVMPWSMHNYVTSGTNEIIRLYEFLKVKEKNVSDKIIEKLNSYVVSCYETKINIFQNEEKYAKEKSYCNCK